MRRTTRTARLGAIAAAALVAALASGAQAFANPGHASCRAFGQEHAFFARELGGLGQVFREAAPLADETALEHDLFCEAK